MEKLPYYTLVPGEVAQNITFRLKNEKDHFLMKEYIQHEDATLRLTLFHSNCKALVSRPCKSGIQIEI